MTSNPFSNPLFLSTMPWIGGTFLLLAAGALWRERRRRRYPDERSLIVPVTTAIIVSSLFLVTLFTGGIALIGFAGLVGLLGLGEYARVTTLDRSYLILVAAWSIASLFLAAFFSSPLLLLLPVGLFLAATVIPIVSGKVDGAHRQAGGAVFGYLYVGLPMAYLVFIRSREKWGLGFLLLVCAAAWLSDVCGYTVGSRVKGPRLAVTVSPGKTWSGAIGSVVGTVAGVLVMRLVIPLALNIAEFVLIGAVIAVSAIWGDLIESFVKRDFKVKDAGSVLPGFGGVLDRFDSLFITIPVTYYVMLGVRHIAS
jgi:phosphatidate cytidylyltransferase